MFHAYIIANYNVHVKKNCIPAKKELVLVAVVSQQGFLVQQLVYTEGGGGGGVGERERERERDG